MTIDVAEPARPALHARDVARSELLDCTHRLEAENAALAERLTRLRVALERLIADYAAARRELRQLRQENRQMRDQLIRRVGD